jgi:hypothetical protein
MHRWLDVKSGRWRTRLNTDPMPPLFPLVGRGAVTRRSHMPAYTHRRPSLSKGKRSAWAATFSKGRTSPPKRDRRR